MRTLLRALLAALVVASAALAVAPSASADEPTLGAIVEGHDGYLQPGCRTYPVDWSVTLSDPGNLYTLTYRVSGPRGERIVDSVYDDEGPTGHEDVSICSTAGAGRYTIKYSIREETPQTDFVDAFTASSSFQLRLRPAASVGLSGSTVTKRSGNRAVHRVKAALRVQGRPVRGQRLTIQVARPTGGWLGRGAVRTNGRGRANEMVTARWGREPMPSRLRIRVCAPATTTHLADCSTKLMRVR